MRLNQTGYDALGRRVSRTSGGVTTQYLYDGLNVARELSTAGGDDEAVIP